MKPLETPATGSDRIYVTGIILALLGGFVTTVGGVTSIAGASVLLILLLPWLVKSELGVVAAWSAILGGLPQHITSSLGLAIFAIPLFLVLWIVNNHVRNVSLVGRLSRLDLLMAAFATLYIVFTIITAPGEETREFLGSCVMFFGSYWLVRSGPASYKRLELIMLAFLFGAAGSAAAVIIQGNYQISAAVRRLGPSGAGVNTYAAYLVAGFGIGIALLQLAKGLYRLLIIAGLAVISVELLFSVSRSAILGVVVTFMFFFGGLRPNRYARGRRAVFFAVLIGVTIVIAISGNAALELIQSRTDVLLNHSQSQYTNDRAYLWPMALQGVKEHPIVGMGVGRFASPDEFYQLGSDAGAPRDLPAGEPHNMFLGIATDTGLVGLVLMLLILGFGFANLMKSSTRLVPFRNGILASLVGVLIANQFQPSQLEPALYLLLGLSELARQVGQRAVLQSKDAANSQQRADLAPFGGRHYRHLKVADNF